MEKHDAPAKFTNRNFLGISCHCRWQKTEKLKGNRNKKKKKIGITISNIPGETW